MLPTTIQTAGGQFASSAILGHVVGAAFGALVALVCLRSATRRRTARGHNA